MSFGEGEILKVKRRLRASTFKRESILLYDSINNPMMRQIPVVGDVLISWMRERIVDEVHFGPDCIYFYTHRYRYQYPYRNVRTVFSHKYTGGDKIKDISIEFKTSDGQTFRLNLMEKNLFALQPVYRKKRRDLLYRITKHMPRIREKKVRHKVSLFTYVLATSLMLIVLTL